MPTDGSRTVTFAGKPMRGASSVWFECHGVRVVKRRGSPDTLWVGTHHATGITASTQYDDPQGAADALEGKLRAFRDRLNETLGEGTD